MSAFLKFLGSLWPSLGVFGPTVLFGLGVWLMLPRGRSGGRSLGALLATAGLAILAFRLPSLGPVSQSGLLYLLGAITCVSSVGTISLRSSVYCALWFAMALLGVSGMYLFSGAQFLGMATIAVYAGAILVTFLFVLMLAQPRGRAFYDRLSWESWLSAGVGACLLAALASVIKEQGAVPLDNINRSAAGGVLHPLHMANFGAELFGRYLIAVEVVGVLLLAALVAASAIVAHGRQAPLKDSTYV